MVVQTSTQTIPSHYSCPDYNAARVIVNCSVRDYSGLHDEYCPNLTLLITVSMQFGNKAT